MKSGIRRTVKILCVSVESNHTKLQLRETEGPTDTFQAAGFLKFYLKFRFLPHTSLHCKGHLVMLFKEMIALYCEDHNKHTNRSIFCLYFYRAVKYSNCHV